LRERFKRFKSCPSPLGKFFLHEFHSAVTVCGFTDMTVVRRSHWSRARPYGRFNRRNERSSEHSSDMISSSREMLASSIADD